ncbi:MAG: hypothetical protein IJD91_01765 [Clostridia bacterium]|nr:hypothetical protein [Clostridia bacterium]
MIIMSCVLLKYVISVTEESNIPAFLLFKSGKSVPFSTLKPFPVTASIASLVIEAVDSTAAPSVAAKTSELGIIVTSIAINNIQAIIFLDFMFACSFLNVLLVEFP